MCDWIKDQDCLHVQGGDLLPWHAGSCIVFLSMPMCMQVLHEYWDMQVLHEYWDIDVTCILCICVLCTPLTIKYWYSNILLVAIVNWFFVMNYSWKPHTLSLKCWLLQYQLLHHFDMFHIHVLIHVDGRYRYLDLAEQTLQALVPLLFWPAHFWKRIPTMACKKTTLWLMETFIIIMNIFV